MPHTDDKTYGPYKIDEVAIKGDNLKRRRLLAISGEVYYHNTALWREALRYMQKIGDKNAEQQIFMKRVGYANNQAAKGIFISMGLTVGVVAAVGVGAVTAAHPLAQAIAIKTGEFARPAWKFYKATTYWRMGINATTQTLLNSGGARDVNMVSVIGEGFSPGMSSLLSSIEWRPFTKNEDIRFRAIGLNKSLSETVYDAGMQRLSGGFNRGITSYVKKQIGREINTELVNNLIKNVAFPIYQTGCEFVNQGLTETIKNDLNKNNIITIYDSKE